MPIAKGSDTISKIMLGGSEIQKAYLGSNLIYDQSVVVPYVAEAVTFDGTNDYLSRGSISTLTTSTGLVSVWFYIQQKDDSFRMLFRSSGLGVPDFYIIANSAAETPGNFAAMARSASIYFRNQASDQNVGRWNHAIYSWDASVPSGLLYVNDILIPNDFGLVSGSHDWNRTTTNIGNDPGDLTRKWWGDMSEFFIADYYLDLSIEANRRKFITADGKPADLGSDGSTPTGTSPLIYFSGDAAAWNSGINKGTGGDFTMNGAVTDSVNEPVELPVVVPFVAEAVTFDGVDDISIRNTSLIGGVDGEFLTCSFWVYNNDISISTRFFLLGTSANQGSVAVPLSGGLLRINLRNAALANIISVDTLDTCLVQGVWQHIIISGKTTSGDVDLQIYVDDILRPHNSGTYNSGNILWEGNNTRFSSQYAGQSPLNGDLSETYLTNEYLDLSSEANRRKFITADGKPVDLGADGSLPTGTAPLVYMSGDAATWNAGTNSGTGGSFTMNGAVTDSVNEPVELPVSVIAEGQGVKVSSGTKASYTGTAGLMTDNKQYTFSYWAKDDTARTGYAGTTFEAWNSPADKVDRFDLLHETWNSNGSNRQVGVGSNTNGWWGRIYVGISATDLTWHHYLYSVDIATGSAAYYLDGVYKGGSTTDGRTTTIPWSLVDYYNIVADTGENASFSDLWVSHEYVDLSVTTNLEKFIKNGSPVYLGANGELPTGRQPEFFFTGNAADWMTNRGYLPSWTMEVGTFTDVVGP